MDNGASKHMTPSTDQMKNLRPHIGKVYIGDNNTIPIHSEGSLEVLSDGKGGYLSSRVYYVPKLGYHLMSVSELCKLGMRVILMSTQSPSRRKLLERKSEGVQWRMEYTSCML